MGALLITLKLVGFLTLSWPAVLSLAIFCFLVDAIIMPGVKKSEAFKDMTSKSAKLIDNIWKNQ